MDAKARIGLAIGGLVLAGMVAYVLLPGGEKPQETPTEPAETEVVNVTPPVEPAVSPVDPFAAPTTAFPPTTLPSADPTVNISGPSTGPAPFATTLPTDTVDDIWERLQPSHADVSPFGSTTADVPATSSDWPDHTVSASAPGPVVSDEPANTMPRTYRIHAGDSFYSIAQKFYGSPKYVSRIQQANRGVDPSRLRVGQLINLPDVDGQLAAASPSLSPRSAVPSGRTYVVQSGDSLRKIAQKVYRDESRWRDIYELNRRTIGSDPGRLKVNQTLQLP